MSPTGESRRFLRFGLGALGIEAGTLLPPGPDHPAVSLVAVALTVVLVGTSAGRRLPRLRSMPALQLALLTAAAVLLPLGSGAGSPISAAAILLPLAWVALHCRRRVLLGSIALGAVLLTLPLVLGAPDQPGERPSSGWNTTIVVLLVAVVVLPAVQRVVADQQARAAGVETIAAASGSLAEVVDSRADLCAIIARSVGAGRVVLLEPRSGAGLATTASTGTGAEPVALTLDELTAAIGVFGGAGRLLLPGTGTVTQPICRAGRPVGVLSIELAGAVARLPDRTGQLLDILAEGTANALVRIEALERLTATAATDPLTGLANRRSWQERVWAEVALASRTGRELSIAMIDLDHFKKYNDAHGHLAGDALLVEFAARLATIAREGDTVARWGGEEFTVLLPGCDLDGASVLAARVLAAVPNGQTCSIGVAQWLPGETEQHWLGRADRALFQAKSTGRARLTASEPARQAARARVTAPVLEAPVLEAPVLEAVAS